jgi:hypothetical protein
MATDKLEKAPPEGPNQALSPAELTAEIVTRYINKYANPQEIMFFLQQCVTFNLNPFKREIFLIKYNADEPGQNVIAYGVFIARAERSLRLKGWRAWVDYAADDQNQEKSPVRAHIEIWRKDWGKPFLHSVRFKEYIGHKKDGSVTVTWRTKEETMIRKVVTCQGFRLAFPDELGDLPFTIEELGQDEPDHNAPTGPMPTAKVEKYDKPKADAPKPEVKVLVPEVVKPTAEEKKPKPAGTLFEAEKPIIPAEDPKKEYHKSMAAAAALPRGAAPAPPAAAKPAKPAPAAAPVKSEAKSGFATEGLKERILSLMAILEKDYGKDPAAMYTAIVDRLEKIFGKKPENFPDDLSALEAAKVIAILENTQKSEEAKKKEATTEEAI